MEYVWAKRNTNYVSLISLLAENVLQKKHAQVHKFKNPAPEQKIGKKKEQTSEILSVITLAF